MTITEQEQHGRDTSLPITHVRGVGDMYRCRCGRDVVAGRPCDGILGVTTIRRLNTPDPHAEEALESLASHLREHAAVSIAWDRAEGQFIVTSNWVEKGELREALGHGVRLADAMRNMLAYGVALPSRRTPAP